MRVHNLGCRTRPRSARSERAVLGADQTRPRSIQIRSVSWAHIASSTLLRAASLVMRLERWALTVPRLMWSSSAISALVRPRATVSRTSSSRSVSGHFGWTGTGWVAVWANVERSRAVTLGQ